MTLSRFLRDYLYVPLGGNRRGPLRRYVNLMITMILGGLWHGANWTFVLWGAMHGAFLLVNHFWRALFPIRHTARRRSALSRAAHILSVFITFFAVVAAWVPFRAETLEATFTIWSGMFGLNGITLHQSLGFVAPDVLLGVLVFEGFMPELRVATGSVVGWLSLGLLVVWCLPNTQQWLGSYSPAWDKIKSEINLQRLASLLWRPTRMMGFCIGIVFAICLMLFNKNSPFLYYQF